MRAIPMPLKNQTLPTVVNVESLNHISMSVEAHHDFPKEFVKDLLGVIETVGTIIPRITEVAMEHIPGVVEGVAIIKSVKILKKVETTTLEITIHENQETTVEGVTRIVQTADILEKAKIETH